MSHDTFRRDFVYIPAGKRVGAHIHRDPALRDPNYSPTAGDKGKNKRATDPAKNITPRRDHRLHSYTSQKSTDGGVDAMIRQLRRPRRATGANMPDAFRATMLNLCEQSRPFDTGKPVDLPPPMPLESVQPTPVPQIVYDKKRDCHINTHTGKVIRGKRTLS